MNTARFRLARAFAFGALLTLPFSAAMGQEVAEKPTLKVGDQWVFTQSIDSGKESIWSRRIVAVGGRRQRGRLILHQAADFTLRQGQRIVGIDQRLEQGAQRFVRSALVAWRGLLF